MLGGVGSNMKVVKFEPTTPNINVPTQHVATLLGATCCVRLASLLRCVQHVGCCCLKFENGQIRANNTQHVATHRDTVAKRTQHVATCCVGMMLRSFGRGLTFSVSEKKTMFKAEARFELTFSVALLTEMLLLRRPVLWFDK